MVKRYKIAIIGAGTVGTTTAYTLLQQNLNIDILLIDSQEDKCLGECMDLSDALYFSAGSSLKKGQLSDARTADIIIITAGVPQKPGQKRSDLLSVNYTIITKLLADLQPLRQDTIIIMVTNPVDILTAVAQKLSGLPVNRIFGAGSFLDTVRLRTMLGEQLSVEPHTIEVTVIGEHGDLQVPLWSSARVEGNPLVLNEQKKKVFAEAVRMKAYTIIEHKGSTAYGVASCIAAYCRAIIHDLHQSIPVSCYREQYNLSIGMPARIGRNGIEAVEMPELSKHEAELFAAAAEKLRKVLDSLSL